MFQSISHLLLVGLGTLLYYTPAIAFVVPTGVSRSAHSFTSPSNFATVYNTNNKNQLDGNRRNSLTIANHQRSALFSLKNLIDNVKATKHKRQTIFVGGKGGVGKTSISSALSVQLAQQGLRVLVVSTDPAHSLGDALDLELRGRGGRPVVISDPLISKSGGSLSACEVDAEAALNDFRERMAVGFNVEKLATSLGVPADLLEGMGLREFGGLLNNPPPGIDELVALGNIMEDGMTTQNYDVVIVDTAPTGHSLRLLALPQFLDGLLGNLIKFRMKLSGLASTFQAFFGDAEAIDRAKTLDTAMELMEDFRLKISKMESTLKDKSLTSFLIVTVPTKLAVEESKRLLTELRQEGIAVNHVVVNQCVEDATTRGTYVDGNEGSSIVSHYHQRVGGQQKWLGKLKQVAKDVSSSEEYRRNGDSEPIQITELPYFNVELVGLPAIGYFGGAFLAENPAMSDLMEFDNTGSPKVIICGGKGGVGKTTTSSALAVTMAAQGHNVCVVSTDPAHSLGDALDMDLDGGQLVDCPMDEVASSVGYGSLSAMEIDPETAFDEFRGMVDRLMGADIQLPGGLDIGGTLQEIKNIFDTLPPGTDEVVALAKVVRLVKDGDFDRIVLDTAPTGHTTRLLGLPTFLAELIDRLLNMAEKVSTNPMLQMFLSSENSGSLDSAFAAAKSKLLSFQLQMYDLEELFANPHQTEFMIVTIPTELAVRESTRLLNDLTFESPDVPIKVRNIVVNQVLRDDETNVNHFMCQLRDMQDGSLANLQAALATVPRPPQITKVRYLENEPRGVFGLKALGDALLGEESRVTS